MQPQELRQKADIHLSRGEPVPAEALLRRCLARTPGDAQANFLLAVALWYQGKAEQCDFFLRKAVAISPNQSKYQNLLGQVCMKAGKHDESIERCKRATELDPTDATAWNALGAMLMLLERAEEAAEPLRKAYELDRSDMTIVCNYAGSLLDNAQVEAGCNVLAEGLGRAPNDMAALITLAGVLNYPEGIPPEKKLDLLTHLGSILDAQARGQSIHRVTDMRPERPLKVGIISADFRTHSCAFFLTKILEYLPKAGFDVVCYDSTHHPDTTTSPRLRALCPAWRRVVGMRDEQVAREISRDGIDIIIETGGHTGSSRVGALAWRPAPVTVSYLGYPGTTGMKTIDYRIVDGITDPPGAERWCTERLARVEGSFLCYDPGMNLPPLSAARPDGGAITFGSFNATKKICQKTLDLWAAVLKEVPGSTLILKGHAHPGGIGDRELRSSLQQRGIDPARLEVLGRTKALEDHMRLYHRLDIALDTYPYTGTTTTCEALLMGVPVVTLQGPLHVSRVSASLLTTVGVPECIAHDDAEFVRIAAGLARDRARLRTYHDTLRGMLLGSDLCNGQRFVERFSAVLRTMWRDACAQSAKPGERQGSGRGPTV